MSKNVETPGEMARAALEREAHVAAAAETRACGPAGVSVPLLVQTTSHGLTKLVHAKTGDVMGQCSSEDVANRTRDFLR